jgi:glycine cleavage system transcriptional repressor
MDWQMLTLVGEDQSGIVAQVTEALFQGGCTLGETSMIRLGGNFTIMLMVSDGERPLASLISALHQHRAPNYQVRVVGADRAGIVARVTGALAKSGFNILELDSDVVGSADEPVYIMTIQGFAEATLETLEAALEASRDADIEVNISPIETLIG